MQAPVCPICGSPMKLRTAQHGKYAGQQFYGCSNYPKCKGIRQIDKDDASKASPQSLKRIPIPRFFTARQRFDDYQVQFFHAIGVSTSIFSLIENKVENGLSDQTKRAFTQWRLDFPSPTQISNFNEGEKHIIAVAEKILTRGRLTLCSPFIEETFSERFLWEKSAKYVDLDENVLYPSVKEINTDYWLDSPAENIFYSEYLPMKFGSSFLRWVCPQADIIKLITSNATPQHSGRVDFLICHPKIDSPVIIEIDGQQHQLQKEQDALRDDALVKEGYRVIRIAASELERLEGAGLASVEELFSPLMQPATEINIKAIEYTQALKRTHQIQLTLLHSIRNGFLSLSDPSTWNLSCDLDEIGLLNRNDSKFVLEKSVEDFLALLRNLGNLYSIQIYNGTPKISSNSVSEGIHISFTLKIHPIYRTFLVQDIFVPFDIANSGHLTNNAILEESPKEMELKYFLNYLFRHRNFLEGQYETITRVLQGKDSIVLLPTGAGKSLIFQLSSLLLPGLALVIEPIIALMDDQLDNLQSFGIDRAIAISSQETDMNVRAQVLSLFGQGEYLLAYIAPERFQIVEFRKAISQLTIHTSISLIAIDEAHCISEWGHDFRTAYLNIGRTSRACCASNGRFPPLVALTGTASRAVLKDVQRELQILNFDDIVTPQSFDRPELQFHVISSQSAEKEASLLGYLGKVLPDKFITAITSFFQSNKDKTYSGLVFCPHVKGDYGVVAVSDVINKNLQVLAGIYCGEKPKYYDKIDWNEYKRNTAKKFKSNQIQLLVCTKAFGMGIDKPNIRFTIHYGLPNSIESFYQEAGRAGRDRKTAHCCILVSVDDIARTELLLDPNTEPEDVIKIINDLERTDGDDITRALYFQTKAFPGIATEKERVALAIKKLENLTKLSHKIIKISDNNRNDAEKALHRLLVLGIISDYTINYNINEFNIKLSGASKEEIIESYGRYVAGYSVARMQQEIEKANNLIDFELDEFALEMTDLLLHFIYDVIERGRRRALSEMMNAAINDPKNIRKRILRYLDATQFSEALEEILAQPDAGLEKTKEVFEKVRSQNEVAELRGQVGRYLESYPDHPGLLMLRALSEAFSRDKKDSIVKQNFFASIVSASTKFGVDKNEIFDFIVWSEVKIVGRDVTLAKSLQLEVLRQYQDRNLARLFIQKSPIELTSKPAWQLLDKLSNLSKELTK